MAALIGSVGCLAGCGGPGSAVDRPAGSALWVSAQAPPVGLEGVADAAAKLADQGLNIPQVSALARAGVGEIFVEAATLEWDGASPRLLQHRLPAMPLRTSASLVVRGAWASSVERAEENAQALERELVSLAFRAEDEGLIVQGFHLELAAPGAPEEMLESLAATLALLRKGLTGQRYLSVGLQAPWLELETLPALADTVDLLVPWLYGNRPRHPRRDEAWDLAVVDAALERMEALETPYLVGVVTLNTIEHLSRRGEVLGRRTDGNLSRLALHPRLDLESGFVLLGLDCRRYDFRVEAPTRLGDWRLGIGERVRVQGLSYEYLRELRRRLSARDLEYWQGQLYFRRPTAEEELTPSVEVLTAALSPTEEDPRLEVEVVPVVTEGDRLRVRLVLRNPTVRTSELIFLDANHLDLDVSGAVILSAEPGDFQRYQLLRADARGELSVSLRQAHLLRLFRPILEPGAEVSTGDIVLRRTSGPLELMPRASFLLPDGSPLESRAQVWNPESQPSEP